jgi:hypothetical protein
MYLQGTSEESLANHHALSPDAIMALFILGRFSCEGFGGVLVTVTRRYL